jgi:hypothetical protein
MNTAFWAVLAAVAALWPARLAGPLDGIPLDNPLEAALLGVVFFFLIVLEPRVLRRPVLRGLVIALLLWKAGTGVTLAQDGWCMQFTTPQPLYRNMGLVPHAWDARADWRSPDPQCSAVMARAYPSIDRFPVWFYNLPPAILEEPATESDRPPLVTLKFALSGFLQAARPGVLRVLAGEDVRAAGYVDGVEVSRDALMAGVPVAAGSHYVSIEGDLRGSRWSLVPTWNGDDLWQGSIATMSSASTADRWIRPWGRYVSAIAVACLIGLSLLMVVQRARSTRALAFSAVASGLAAASAMPGRPAVMRLVPLLLVPVAAMNWPRRLQTRFGACLLIGVPFLALVIAIGAPQAGVVTWYTAGDDWWMFQRYAYRIFLQGYWLEGGQPTFWFQPLYRWIAGSLHMIFGDSSVGETFWDAACILTGSLFAFSTTRAVAGFRWAVAAAVTVLAVFTLGPGWYLMGRGLSEISSAGLIYGAALLALRGRHGYWPAIIASGVLATLGFYTRLNNLTIALAVALFALPVSTQSAELLDLPKIWRRASARVLFGVLGAIVLGLCLFSLRTWYYTGVFSLFHGTQATALTVWQATDDGQSTPHRVIGSVLMVLTMNDPPRFDVRAIPIIAGVLVSLLAVFQVRPFRKLPLNLVGFCLAGLSGALIARGTAYPGRFSVHLIPVTVALTMCALSQLLAGRRAGRSA